MALHASVEIAPEALVRLGPARLLVRVRSITYAADDINLYEVVDPAGALLPPFSAGSHIDLYFRDRRIRQYSLCNDPRERHRYCFAVQREKEGRGGSKAIFERVHVGRMLAISRPRNNFPLAPDARWHLLLAAGIGITPIMAMIHALRARGEDFELHYCARSAARTAFLDELEPERQNGRARVYHDGGDPSRGPDLRALLHNPSPGRHVYYCGPTPFMHAVAECTAHWPRERVHCEYFVNPDEGVPDLVPAPSGGDIPVGFQVRLARSGGTYDVPNDKSILHVLHENGIDVPSSCEAGLCGTCRTRYLEGVPEHRDYILDDDERMRDVLICCARSRTPLLVLDL
jgi:vanillate O-demethylase ferredoxin subunit